MGMYTLAFPIGRQKLESRASAETGNNSPYLYKKVNPSTKIKDDFNLIPRS